jgi:hypothetical protein
MTVTTDFDTSGGGSTSGSEAVVIYSVEIPEDLRAFYDLAILAVSADDSALWRVTGRLRRSDSGDAELVGTQIDIATPQKTAGASTWDAVPAVNGALFQYVASGADATQVVWVLNGHIVGVPISF